MMIQRTMGRRIVASVFLSMLFLISPGIGAEDSGPIEAGDKATIQFTCRLENGELAATTDKSMMTDPVFRKSPLFVARNSEDPLVITAGAGEESYGPPGQRGFEGEIIAALAQGIWGMGPGDKKEIIIKKDKRAGKDSPPAVVNIARIRLRPKEVRMTPEEYKRRASKDPEVGQEYTVDPAFPGKVASLTSHEVVVRLEARPEKSLDTPFGKGEVRETEKHYQVFIDAEVGRLVRTGGMAGRIVNVDENTITIDYSHPLAYEVVKCEVLVESVEKK